MEASPTEVKQLLRSLVGQTIRTLTGRPNTILRVEDDQVIVATNKSHYEPSGLFHPRSGAP
jgi:hypothetical protein